jgi:four helix bundle protein
MAKKTKGLEEEMMTLIVHEVALEMARELGPMLVQLGRHDAKLLDQIRRAAASVVLNVGEAAYSQGGNQRARFYSAAGSASETRSGLQLAVVWGYVDSQRAKRVDALLDRILAMLWGLTTRDRRKKGPRQPAVPLFYTNFTRVPMMRSKRRQIADSKPGK